MLKYVNSEVVFREIPDEIILAINISNCPCHCKGCHSAYLAQDIGEDLTMSKLTDLILNNPGITCVAFMGGDSEPSEVSSLAKDIYDIFFGLKVAWYSGRDELSKDIDLCWFDYIKLGHYDEKLGPLDSLTTNQRLYKIEWDGVSEKADMVDITYKFWRNNGN